MSKLNVNDRVAAKIEDIRRRGGSLSVVSYDATSQMAASMVLAEVIGESAMMLCEQLAGLTAAIEALSEEDPGES